MISRQVAGLSVVAILGAGLFSISAPAAMLPAAPHAKSGVQAVDCAVGAHIGPLGGCIFGSEPPPPAPVVIERRAADAPPPGETATQSVTQHPDGCVTHSEEKTNGMGDSMSRSQTNC